jgi:hypothetical protein
VTRSVGVLVFVPLAARLKSYMRFTTTMLPVVVAAGVLLARRPRTMQAGFLVLGTINGFMMVCWMLGLTLVM